MIANIFYRSYANHLPPNNIIASLHKKKAHPEDVPDPTLTTAYKNNTKSECAMLLHGHTDLQICCMFSSNI